METKLNIREWKEFIVGDLFNLINSTAYHKKDITESEENDNKIAYITRSKFNNGLNMYVKKEDLLNVNPKNTISFGAENANFFFQEEEYITGNKMYYVDTRNLKPHTILFIKTIFEKSFSDNYSFSDGMIPERIRNKKIKLPVDEKGNPDWNYMEQYMKSIEKKSLIYLKNLNKSSNQSNKMNITEWKPFHLYDIFNIDPGTKMDKVAMKFNNPTINFVGRSGTNNGVTAIVDEVDGYKPYKAGNLTLALGGAYLGSCFIQEKDFYTSQNVIVLIPKINISFNAKKFICSVIFKEGNTHYKAFINELNRHINTDFTIMLPIDEFGNPDYKYMDEYIKNIYNNIKKKIKTLQNITK